MNRSVLASRKTSAIAGFEALSSFLLKASGIVLGEDKQYLVESKVMPIVGRERLSGLAELVGLIERGARPALAEEVVEAMTVNETYFFRDKVPFDVVQDTVLPRLMAARAATKTIRIWSAACSAGQEPYSLAMLWEEHAKAAGYRLEIVATDISEKILAKAVAGVYTAFDVQRGLGETYRRKYFKGLGNHWQISEQIKRQVTFKKFNLLDDFGPLGTFDIVFCRNVLIYFDAGRKRDIVRRMEKVLAPDGYLFLGASESLIGLSTSFTPGTKNQFFTLKGA